MLSNAMLGALNDQFKHEFYSSYLYLSMAAHFEAANWPGFAHWMKLQSHEEMEHAMKFYEYIFDQGGKVTLQALEQPPAAFGTPLQAFQAALEHERFITSRIHQLYAQAVQENDYASQVLLQWYVKEQVEEEKNATQIVDTLKLVGDAPAALFMLNAQLGGRGG